MRTLGQLPLQEICAGSFRMEGSNAYPCGHTEILGMSKHQAYVNLARARS